MKHRTCAVTECGKPSRSRGWCPEHYQKWYKTGDPNYVRPTFEQRLLGKIDFSGDCWEWTAVRSPKGYGHFHTRPNQLQVAHRAVWEFLIGPLDDDEELDHLCRNRGCVNPDHLEPVPGWVNNLRGFSFSAINLGKSHCVNGHLFDQKNTYWRPGGKGRRCVECRKASDKRVRERRKAAPTSA